ncbi:MAG: hypothetical protein ACI8S6_005209 [Myxococcota bacterium]|jgi:hypothetical protein
MGCSVVIAIIIIVVFEDIDLEDGRGSADFVSNEEERGPGRAVAFADEDHPFWADITGCSQCWVA